MSHSTHAVVFGALVSLLLCWSGAASHAAAQSRLADVTSLTCSFSVISTGDWVDGEPSVEHDSSTLRFQFVEIDTDGATANAVGPFGPSHIITRQSGEYLHFMQLFNVGPLYTTTVIDRETRDGKLKAVHTRHEFTDVRLTGFTSRPEQYIGECEIGE